MFAFRPPWLQQQRRRQQQTVLRRGGGGDGGRIGLSERKKIALASEANSRQRRRRQRTAQVERNERLLKTILDMLRENECYSRNLFE